MSRKSGGLSWKVQPCSAAGGPFLLYAGGTPLLRHQLTPANAAPAMPTATATPVITAARADHRSARELRAEHDHAAAA
jgi:hypothetical protein